MAKKAANPETALQLGDMVTVEVAIPNCGLEKGHRKTMRLTCELRECIENGFWKLASNDNLKRNRKGRATGRMAKADEGVRSSC